MISVQEALKIVQSNALIGNIQSKSLQYCFNDILAEDVRSLIDMPPFAQSAMDGYAVNFADGITNYSLVGEVQAGSGELFELSPGEAVRIFTGAAVPPTANMVVKQEDVTIKNDTIEFIVPAVGSNIRPQGEQVKKGELALEAGSILNPAAVGYLTTLGISEVKTFQKPKVTILTTGNELVKAGNELKHGQIYESNSFMLEAAFKTAGIPEVSHMQIRDDYQATFEGIKSAIENHDIVILSGGISVGDYDFVHKALTENGVKQLFYKVNQKPGKPLYFGKKGSKRIFALPGNPAAALTSFYVYILPMLNQWMGKEFKGLISAKLPITHDYQRKGNRTVILKAHFEGNGISILGAQSSAMLSSFAKADALVFITNQQNDVKSGELVDVLLF